MKVIRMMDLRCPAQAVLVSFSDDGSPRRRFEADGDRSPRRRFAEDIRCGDESMFSRGFVIIILNILFMAPRIKIDRK